MKYLHLKVSYPVLSSTNAGKDFDFPTNVHDYGLTDQRTNEQTFFIKNV